MNIGWILLIAAISVVALYVIFRPRGKTVAMYGKPLQGTSRWVGQDGSRWVDPPKATLTERSQAAETRQPARVSRDQDTDTGVTDALLLAAVLTEDAIYVEPERPYVAPTPSPSYDSTPSYQSSDSDRGGGYSDSGGSSDGGGGGGGD